MVEHRPDKAEAESSSLSIPTSGILKGVPIHIAGIGETIVPPEMITVPITYLSDGKLHSWRFMGGRWVHTSGA